VYVEHCGPNGAKAWRKTGFDGIRLRREAASQHQVIAEQLLLQAQPDGSLAVVLHVAAEHGQAITALLKQASETRGNARLLKVLQDARDHCNLRMVGWPRRPSSAASMADALAGCPTGWRRSARDPQSPSGLQARLLRGHRRRGGFRPGGRGAAFRRPRQQTLARLAEDPRNGVSLVRYCPPAAMPRTRSQRSTHAGRSSTSVPATTSPPRTKTPCSRQRSRPPPASTSRTGAS